MPEHNSTDLRAGIELIFHVGLGKTGSSSIQASLLNCEDKLRNCNIHYLGQMLEYSPIKTFEWQKPSGANIFYQGSSQSDSLFKAIDEALITLSRKGYKKAIISNEWFGGCNYEFSRNQSVVDAIRKLCASGYRVTVVAYVRDHVSWALSAYQQWCLKHKTLKGSILPFKEYSLKRQPKFAITLESWAKSGARFEVFNFNRLKNVVAHFGKKYIDEETALEVIQENLQPTDNELYLRTCFNERFGNGREVRPDEFDRHFRRVIATDNAIEYVEWFSTLLPSESDLVTLLDNLKEDIGQINDLLVSQEEQPLYCNDLSSALTKLKPPDSRELANYLTDICFQLSTENLALRERLQKRHDQR